MADPQKASREGERELWNGRDGKGRRLRLFTATSAKEE
jgi:hypothetical protein